MRITLPETGTYYIVTRDNKVGTNYVVHLLGDSEIQQITDNISKSVVFFSKGISVERANVSICHNRYQAEFRDIAWGIAWLRNTSEDYISSDMIISQRSTIEQSGETEVDALDYHAFPGATSFVLLPATLQEGLTMGIDWETWASDSLPILHSENMSFAEEVQRDFDIGINIERHFSERGFRPYYHHSLSLTLTNEGDFPISGDNAMMAFAVYGTDGTLIDIGVLSLGEINLTVGETNTVLMSSSSLTGSCTQAFDPLGHEIWIGLMFEDENGMVHNTFEQFPVGSTDFEINMFGE
jgi:hypothetical protein